MPYRKPCGERWQLHACNDLVQRTCADAVPDRYAAAVQDLENALEGTARAGTGEAKAGSAKARQALSSQLAQFAEAQRIIVLDAIRTDFSQSRQMPAASFTGTRSAHTGSHCCPYWCI